MNLMYLLQLDDYPEKWRDIEDALLKGENPNEISSDDGVCAMHVAAGLGEKATSLLLQHGGCPNIESVDGTTPLHVAASWGCKSAIITLLQHGADSMQKDENCKIPYDLALEGGYNDCALLLEPKCQSLSSVLGCGQVLGRDQNFTVVTSPNSSSQTITQKLHKYLKEGTPVYFDVTSPDSPCVKPKQVHPSPLRQRKVCFDSAYYSKLSPCTKVAAPASNLSQGSLQHSCSSSPISLVDNVNIGTYSCGTQRCHHISNCLKFQSHKKPSSSNVCGLHQHNLNPLTLSSYIKTCSELLCTCDCANNQSIYPHSCSPYISHNQSHFCLDKPYECASLNPVVNNNQNSQSLEEPHYSSMKRSDSKRKIQPVEPFLKHLRDSPNHLEVQMKLNKYRIDISANSSTKSELSFSSFPMSAYSSTLASSVASPRDKVAAFVLSSVDFMSQCSVKDNENISANFQQDVESKSVDNSESHSEQTVSDSSAHTFETCLEGPCVESLVNEKERELHLTKDNTFGESNNTKLKLSQSKWKPPTNCIAVDVGDIVTSDESFLSHRSPRVYRMKKRPVKMGRKEDSSKMEKRNKNCTNMPPPNMPRVKSSNDSLFSTVSEVVVTDEESGIVLIERHNPSVSGGSVGRRSLDSITSAATVDSQATLIYDWHTLGRLCQQHGSDSSKGSFGCKKLFLVKRENDTSEDYILSSQSLSRSSNDIISPSFQTQDDFPDSEIPDHLSKLSCEEISQRLQQYGELPGPIIASTKQVYLKRLTSLEANPGLITLSSKIPDFPLELRQALEGKFDSSHLPNIEAKMVEEFSAASSANKQWREGTVKSSFTYLLLDPRVTKNLPLRAKEMTDLEVFKTFICSIFYIGKGKRARPYCHLHEAVRIMNRANINNSCKANKKVQQVIEIWKSGLGVVSLHCFQSVIPVEAYTREACMIEAIGIHKLTNIKRGDFYGVSSTWSMQLRRQVGVYLLQKALQIFLADGERQICLPDLST